MPPLLQIGTHGKVNHRAQVAGKWMPLRDLPDGATPDVVQAYTNFRDLDGVTRKVSASGPTQYKADRALKAVLKERSGGVRRLSSESRFADLATAYLERVQRTRAVTTLERYRTRLNVHVLPNVGQLRLRECTVGRFQALMDQLAERLDSNTLAGIRTVLSGVMQEAVDRDLISANPVREMRDIEPSRKRKAPAYDHEQLVDFFARLDGDEESRRADLPDLLRFYFAVGVRFGEALALRWQDVNLTDEPVLATNAWGERVRVPARSIWINGNLVAVSGGVARNDGKTFAARRVIVLPDYMHLLLSVRKPDGAPESEPVFPSTRLGWRHPSNVQRAVRSMRKRIGYPDFTTKVGRRSVATALDAQGFSAREIADILGHARPSMTQDVYMDRGRPNTRAASALDRLHGPAA
ncbi:tyrosine recombinase XerC [Actinosynnema sp. NPDC059335]|uniref:site-specific integrase n=1 Tax=Actinosynnema sp. NPDC059335 TaxID=3346804 RepID=UPI00366A90B6